MDRNLKPSTQGLEPLETSARRHEALEAGTRGLKAQEEVRTLEPPKIFYGFHTSFV